MFIIPLSRITVTTVVYWHLHIYLILYNLNVKAMSMDVCLNPMS